MTCIESRYFRLQGNSQSDFHLCKINLFNFFIMQRCYSKKAHSVNAGL